MKRIFLIIFCVLAAVFNTAAQGSAPLKVSLEQCRAIALDSSKVIYHAMLAEEKADYDRKAVFTNFLPKFSAYGYYLYTSNTLDYDFPGGALPIYKNVYGNLVPDLMTDLAGNVVYNNGIPVFNQYAVIPPLTLSIDPANTFVAGIMVRQPVFMGGKIASAYSMAKIGTQMAGLNREMKRSEVIVEVDKAYWLLVEACQLVEAAESFVETVEGMQEVAANAAEVGMATSNDMLKIKVQYDNARLALAKAENGKKLAMMNLCHCMGIPLTTTIETDGKDAEIFPVPGQMEEVSVEDRADFKLLQKQAELKKKEIAFVRSDFLPQIGIMASYGYSYGIRLQGDPLLDQGGFGLVASVKIPIFAWGEGYFKIKSARKEHSMALSELRRMEELMVLEKSKNEFALSEAAMLVEMTGSALENAECNLRICQDQYETGMETAANVLQAQTQWHKCKSDHIKAVAEQRLAYTQYLKSIGKL